MSTPKHRRGLSVHDASTEEIKWHPFEYDGSLPDGFSLISLQLGCQAENEDLENSESDALESLRNFVSCFDTDAYLIYAGTDVSRDSAVRVKKETLKNDRIFSGFERKDLKIPTAHDATRLVTVVALAREFPDQLDAQIWNYRNGFVLLTPAGLDTVSKHAKNWFSHEENSVLAIDFQRVVDDIRELKNTVALRCFYADNGRNDMLVAIGPKGYVEKQMEHLSGYCQ